MHFVLVSYWSASIYNSMMITSSICSKRRNHEVGKGPGQIGWSGLKNLFVLIVLIVVLLVMMFVWTIYDVFVSLMKYM